MHKKPSKPYERLAIAISNWNGLPVGHPICSATWFGKKACPINAYKPAAPIFITIRYKRKTPAFSGRDNFFRETNNLIIAETTAIAKKIIGYTEPPFF